MEEKNKWIEFYLPEIDLAHRIFPPCGEDKKKYIPTKEEESEKSCNFLLDDYTKNLTLWESPYVGIKLLNNINNTHGTWKGKKVPYDMHPPLLAEQIAKIIKGDQREKNLLLHNPGKCR